MTKRVPDGPEKYRVKHSVPDTSLLTCSGGCERVGLPFGDLVPDGRRTIGLKVPIICRECWERSEQDRKRIEKRLARERDPELVRQRYRKWSLKKHYGITVDEFDRMLGVQSGCAICHTDVPDGKNWHVDHDHVSGKVRGVLCHSCNLMIGMSKEDTDILSSAISYLRHHSEQG